MPIGEIRQTLDVVEINRQLHAAGGGVVRDMLRRGLRVQGRARRRAPARTGRLRGSLQVASTPRVVFGVSTYGVVVGTNVQYARWVHDGTGIYGPHHSPIRPTHNTYLVFKGRRGNVVRVRQVIGQPPHPFLKQALTAARGQGGVT